MRGDLLVDGRNFLDPARCARRARLRGHRPPAPAARQPRARVQALILAGGEGTRLRPLTTTVPKPVVPLVDRPFIVFMLDWLRRHGVDDSSCLRPHGLGRAERARRRRGFDVRLRYVEEPRPLAPAAR